MIEIDSPVAGPAASDEDPPPQQPRKTTSFRKRPGVDRRIISINYRLALPQVDSDPDSARTPESSG
jgi:hypothetical protein